jgi:hypothetical protein
MSIGMPSKSPNSCQCFSVRSFVISLALVYLWTMYYSSIELQIRGNP